MDSSNTNNTTTINRTRNAASKPFKLPSRAELEERRKQLEANKPALHFKPKGIASNHASQSPGSATNSDTSENDQKPSSSTTRQTRNSDTQTLNKSTSAASNATIPTPTIVSSRQPHRQQPHPREPQQNGKQPQSPDDDFDFGDDLGDIFFDDSIFEMDDSSTKAPNQSIKTTAPTPSIPSSIRSSIAPSVSAPVDETSALVAAPAFVPKSKSTIVVKPSQRGNPLLQFIRNVPYEYGEIIPDFVVGLTSCILFLSIRYHRLHPEYIFNRIAALGKTFVLRVLLLFVDVETHQQAIRELTRVAMLNDLTIICVWSNEEAARYIETFKAYENKAPDAIKERVDNDYLSKLTDCLTQIQSVNKTDVVTLSSTFGSFKNIMNASVDELGLLPGFGERKVVRLLEAFDQPFAIDPKKRRHRR
ncbi:Excision repair cross-complementation group 1 [Mortierella sp. GBA30]|nr:Excision repair cross-complementation group 1 [Mortierella sp. GBA30]